MTSDLIKTFPMISWPIWSYKKEKNAEKRQKDSYMEEEQTLGERAWRMYVKKTRVADEDMCKGEHRTPHTPRAPWRTVPHISASTGTHTEDLTHSVWSKCCSVPRPRFTCAMGAGGLCKMV
jgi:hypothetical protein